MAWKRRGSSRSTRKTAALRGDTNPGEIAPKDSAHSPTLVEDPVSKDTSVHLQMVSSMVVVVVIVVQAVLVVIVGIPGILILKNKLVVDRLVGVGIGLRDKTRVVGSQ